MRFAIGIQPREPVADFPLRRLDGEALTWPKTVEPGDVRSLELNFGLAVTCEPSEAPGGLIRLIWGHQRN